MVQKFLENIIPPKNLFTKHFILSKLRRYLSDICNGVGEERLKWMVENNRPFREFLPKGLEGEIKISAHQYQWVEQMISDDEFISCMPMWARKVITPAWMQDTITWLRGMFK